MKTLSILILLSTLIVWLIRYNKAKKEEIKFNPFEHGPLIFNYITILLTAFSISIMVLFCLIVLP